MPGQLTSLVSRSHFLAGARNVVWKRDLRMKNGVELSHLRVSSPTLAEDENWFLCMSVTARWSHVVWLWSLNCPLVGWVAPLVPVAEGALDCDSVGSSWEVVLIVVFYGSHLFMVGLGSRFGCHYQRCNLLQNFFFLKCFICAFDIYVLFMCFNVCVLFTCLAINQWMCN